MDTSPLQTQECGPGQFRFHSIPSMFLALAGILRTGRPDLFILPAPDAMQAPMAHSAPFPLASLGYASQTFMLQVMSSKQPSMWPFLGARQTLRSMQETR